VWIAYVRVNDPSPCVSTLASIATPSDAWVYAWIEAENGSARRRDAKRNRPSLWAPLPGVCIVVIVVLAPTQPHTLAHEGSRHRCVMAIASGRSRRHCYWRGSAVGGADAWSSRSLVCPSPRHLAACPVARSRLHR
jgi:hypothetical protein